MQRSKVVLMRSDHEVVGLLNEILVFFCWCGLRILLKISRDVVHGLKKRECTGNKGSRMDSCVQAKTETLICNQKRVPRCADVSGRLVAETGLGLNQNQLPNTRRPVDPYLVICTYYGLHFRN